MRIQGVEITQKQINQGVAAMVGAFSYDTLTLTMAKAGVPTKHLVDGRPYNIAAAAADRLLQRERKAGNIAFRHRRWIKLEPKK